MDGDDFIRLLKRLGRRTGRPVVLAKDHGKGSHGRLYDGNRYTTMKDRKKELKKGLLADMLRQLGLSLDDLRRKG